MRNLLLIFSFLFLYCSFSQGQYVVKSNNINNPDLNIEYVRNNVEFWIKYAYDPIKGGFFSNISRNGTILTTVDAGISSTAGIYEKSLIAQTRQAYGFSKAFMLTGDEKYLTYAKSAVDFLTTYGWDTTNDGWYCFAKSDGSLDNNRWWNPNTGKWGFQQHYANVGIIANYEATHDSNVKSWMDKGINSIYTHMWDSRPGYEGYYEQSDLNWQNGTGKGFTSTVDAITTNGEMAYLVTQDPAKKARLAQLANIIVTRFIPQMDNSKVKALYPEGYDTNWNCTSYNSDGSIGHFIKTSWCLGRAYLCDTTKKEIKNAAIKILDQAWTYKNGSVTIWDHVNGGPFNCINTGTGNWGGSGDNKDYWTLEQGFTGPMINYYITKNPIYLQMADESIDFYMKHFIDTTYGETYQELDPTGKVVRLDSKGDDFKANYHAQEFGYYAYLYSNLYYLNKPASLYYKFAATTNAQNIVLTPIPMEDNVLRIKSVTLDGANFTSFNSITRTLNIAANQGGKFYVTYEAVHTSPTAVETLESTNINIFPNPTNGIINIDGLEKASKLSVVDLTGKNLIEVQVDGKSSTKINIEQLNQGIYFVVVLQKSGLKVINKVIKQ